MDNNTYNSAGRRRNVVTPAERKAAEERKLAAEKASVERKAREEEAKRREMEARRRSSVKTSSKGTVPPMKTGGYAVPPTTSRNTTVSRGSSAPYKAPTYSEKNVPDDVRGTTRTTHPSAKSERELHEQQRQIMMQQRQIETLERQIREEKERRSAFTAQHRHIAELEHKVRQQQLLRDNMIDRDAEKDNPKENIKWKYVGICVIALLIIVNIIFFASLTRRNVPDKPTEPSVPAIVPGDITDDTAIGTSGIEPTTVQQTVAAKDYTNGVLILVNSEYPYDFDNEGTDIRDDQLVTVAKEIPDKSYKASNYKTYLNSETVKMLNLMMTDFYAYSGRDDVMVNTAYRTYEQQKEILDAKKEQLGDNQRIAQTPGNSEHHTGYAFDFSIYPKNENGSTFINIGEYAWIYENCHKYGFILRYPEGKTAITGIDPESWHFRYVGIPHATYMYQKGRTLEEYISDISIYSENIPLTINVSDTESYSVFHVNKTDADRVTFSVPKDTEYRISGDNASGFVVWYNNADIGMKGKIPPVSPDSDPSDTTNETDASDKGADTQTDNGITDAE